MGPAGSDQFLYNTTRIETVTPLGASRGTGFYFSFCCTGAHEVVALVTNKHVVRGATKGMITFNLATGAGTGVPAFRQFVRVERDNFESLWVPHPDPNVDLAILPLGPILAELEAKGQHPFIVRFTMDNIADQAFLDELSAVEEILMIGYPTGLADETNNRPIIRRGITATPAYDFFGGEPKFMIDCACFPGSSGSPVVLFSQARFNKGTGSVTLAPHPSKLLGILFSGPQWTAAGEVIATPVPTAVGDSIATKVMINLGWCVRADQLVWFEDYIRPRLQIPA